MNKARAIWLLLIAVSCSPAFASVPSLEVDGGFGNWLLGVVTALVIVSIAALFKTVLLVRELVIEVAHLKSGLGDIKTKVDKHEAKHENFRDELRRVEDTAREGRSKIYDYFARSHNTQHTPVHGSPKVDP